ncbi:dihydrolipoamide dehydrogenase [Enterococcus villorum]|uniref:Dihydrolipoamide dehydrogenase n=1 Tax=Enterococcus villorum TaxID=112904 RepID=A0A1V8YDM5_9ENTE|nr:dihydrolipoamide dehydrogenase [Enterococcus villorum]OQO70703.1 dihydrolipoamide dehydrogenase [Enterococcus villorum]OQO76535.1 dihydrolipoamide dehydrogenase [Enterococcus villorum]
MKQTVEKWLYLTVDDHKKRLNAVEQLTTKEEKPVYALIFEDESYLIIDQKKQPVEYGPAAQSYKEAIESYQIVKTSEEVNRLLRFLDIKEDDSLIKPKKNGQELLDCWVGLPEKRFLTYKNWRTPAGYLCGTYAAMVLLAYYQDFQNERMIPPNLRTKGSKESEKLRDALRKTIQPLGLPTVPLQVSHGITKFLKENDYPCSARSTVAGSSQRATKRIRQGKPVILGVLKVLGSPYGNHWVTAYAYYESSSGERFYKVHDNWGNYERTIPAKWCNGTVSLP